MISYIRMCLERTDAPKGVGKWLFIIDSLILYPVYRNVISEYEKSLK